jgi:ribosome maturation factor RimP
MIPRTLSLIPNRLIGAILFSAAFFPSAPFAGGVDKYIKDLKAGPIVYYTPEAAAYYASFSSAATTGISVNKDAAIHTFMATIKLGAMQLGEVREAIPVLIDIFPKAVHVAEVRQAQYVGRGSLEDCISTYIMSAKNQFMMSCPFLDFNSLSQCDQFIESTNETEMISSSKGKKGAISQAVFNLRITFSFYGGECALSRLTGMSLGHDPAAWRQWWQSASPPVTSASPYTYVVSSPGGTMVTKNTWSDIVTGGKYRVTLTTGDDLTGTVESRDDTSMVLETTGGKPYAFKFTLIQSYQVIEMPAPKPAATTAPGSTSAEIITFDQLRQRASGNPELEVTLNKGSVFKGKLQLINDDGITLNIEGSPVPIARDVIKQIVFIPFGMAQKAAKKEKQPEAPKGPFDTLYIKNQQTDNYGNPKPDILHAGTIIDQGDNYVTMKPLNGNAPEKYNRDDISRFIRHSASSAEDAIKRYAKPLSCPSDMFMVDMPPGRGGKPFFKVCVDKYEYPNKSGTVPRTKLSYGEAKKLCEQQGKRLCTTQEWMWACGGEDGLPYPYGKSLEQDRCNTDIRLIETSGNRINCVSPFGGSDMSGNLFEWVTAKGGGMALMGGPVSKCQTIAQAASGDAKPQSGVRCCKSN